MKALVYIVAFLILVIVQVAIQTQGIILGAIPTVVLYLIVMACASAICKKIDQEK